MKINFSVFLLFFHLEALKGVARLFSQVTEYDTGLLFCKKTVPIKQVTVTCFIGTVIVNPYLNS